MKIERFVVGMLETNSYLITQDSGECVLIDAPFAEQPYLDTICALGERLKWILLTHRHFDHILAVKQIQEATGAQIAISQKDAAGLKGPQDSAAQLCGLGHLQQPVRPDQLLQDGDTLHIGDLTFRVLLTPGHTVGSVCFLCGNVLWSGDTLFAGSAGRTDLPTGDTLALTASLRGLCRLPGDYRVLPGHGEETTLEQERRSNPFLADLKAGRKA